MNLIEKYLVLNDTLSILSQAHVEKLIWPALGIRNQYEQKRLLTIHSLIDEIRDKISSEDLRMNFAEAWMEFSPEEQKIIISRFSGLMLNQNQWIFCLETLNELRRRNRMNLEQVLSDLKPENADGLLGTLRMKRNPRLSERRRRFDEAVRRLHPGDEVQILPPPFFEKPGVELRAKIQSKADIVKLKKLLESEEWDNLLEVTK